MTQPKHSPREVLSLGMIQAASAIGGGVYHVRRGRLPWAPETWEGKDYACGLIIRASEPFRKDGQRTASVLAYFLGRSDAGESREIDLELSDRVARHAGEFLILLQSAKVDGDPAVLGIEQESATVDDVADADFRVQGVIVTFEVLF